MDEGTKAGDQKTNSLYLGIMEIITIVTLLVVFKPFNYKEPTIARIDISTPVTKTEKSQFKVYVDASDTPEKQVDWMAKNGNIGYAIQKKDNKMDILIKDLNNNKKITITLRGPDKRDESGEFIPVWVKFTSVTINGDEILPETAEVWHNKPMRHTINAEAGEEYKIHAEWIKTDK